MPMKDVLPNGVINNVVVLMLENRGFDHIMGWLYPKETPQKPRQYQLVSYDGDDREFIGLSTLTKEERDALVNPLPTADAPLGEGLVGNGLPINEGARSPKTPSFNTGESFEHIMNQMWELAEPEATWFKPAKRLAQMNLLQAQGVTIPPMTGYVRDYDIDVFANSKKRLGPIDLSEVLDTYLPEQMPVLSGLARSYAVSDDWFCSVPSQTNTNRAFSMAGTSRGMVNNSFYDPPTYNPGVKVFSYFAGGKSHADTLPVTTRSLFEVLQENRFSWKVYWQTTWPPVSVTLGVDWQYVRTMLPLFADKQFDPNFVQFDASKPDNPFFNDIAAGSLPAVSWIEPKWGGGPAWDSAVRQVGNDYHPVSDTTVGEDFVMSVYHALVQGPQWPNTLLVITFDENGGTYDHVPPPSAPPPGNESCPLVQPHIPRGDMEPTEDGSANTQYGFGFDQFGVRVPTLLISPQIPPKTVFRSTEAGKHFDHTSLIASILKLAGVGKERWLLGDRVDQAPTFEAVIGQSPAQDGRENLNKPDRPLSIPDGRPDAPELSFNRDYILQYIGDPWRAKPGLAYLAPQFSPTASITWYPTLTGNPFEAQTFKLQLKGSEQGQGPIGNMSMVRIVTNEAPPSRNSGTLVSVSSTDACAFYKSSPAEGSDWQIRLLGSRERGDKVREGDRVCFISQLKPVVTGDPLQRLLPHPDPGKAKQLTTRAGEWGLWRILPADAATRAQQQPKPSAN